MKPKLLIIAMSLVAMMSVHNALAWGGWGHHMTAYIAEKHLTPVAKQKCEQYLRHSLPHYSSWQDSWRNSPPFEEIHYWHMNYVDMDYITIGRNGDITRDAVTQIERITRAMSKGQYRNMTDSLVAVNLKLLIHMVGDMHCPSHLSYPKESRLVGYSIKVRGKSVGRHAFWDSAPTMMHPKWNADQFLKACDTYSPKQIKKIGKGTPSKWSFENANKMVETYRYWGKGANFSKLSKEQRKQIDDMTREQLAYGGYRLATILNKIFSK